MAAETTGAGIGLAKLISSPGAIGVLAGALGFSVLWPKTPKEGISRLVVSGMSSHFFGEATHSTALHFLPWLANTDARAACYLVAGLPAWWILGAVIKYLNRGQDIKEMAKDLMGGAEK